MFQRNRDSRALRDRIAALHDMRPERVKGRFGIVPEGLVRRSLIVKSDNLRVFRRLAEAFPDLRSRFIVQIQLPEEYETLRDGEWVRYEA